MGQRRWRAVLGAVLGLVLGFSLGVVPASGQELSAGRPGWQFELTPYLWLAGLSGDVGIRNSPSVSVDAEFSDIVKDLDFGALVTFEARKGAWGLLLDGIYLKVSKDGDTPGAGFSRVDVTQKTGIIEPALAYRVWESPFASLDAFAGARIWVVDTELKFSGGILQPRTFGDTQAWADPVLGARLRAALWEGWSAILLGDVGGFGVASDFTWQVFAGLGYQFTERWSLKIGYRALGVDYENSGLRLDIVQHGPLMGLGIRF